MQRHRFLLLLLATFVYPAHAISGLGEFQQPGLFQTGFQPNDVQVADFNGDGKPDIATLNFSLTVSVLLGNGDGTFRPPIDSPTGKDSFKLVAADLNGDGKPDLAATAQFDNVVVVLLGNGDGTFQAPADYPTGSSPTGVSAGDVNGDSKLDLVTADYTGGSVSILLGNGDGTFLGHTEYNTATWPIAVAIGDLNRDGKMDLVTSNNPFNGDLSVLLGNGDGSFQNHIDYPLTETVGGVAIADLDNDGVPDLITAVGGAYGAVFRGLGDGSFQGPTLTAWPVGPVFVAAADLNHDGRPDLLSSSAGAFGVLIGKANDTFQLSSDYGIGVSSTRFATGDFNLDGNLDVVTSGRIDNNFVSVLLGNGDGTFQSFTHPLTSASVDEVGVAIGDLDGDGNLDLATGTGGSALDKTVAVRRGRGHGVFDPAVSYDAGPVPRSVAIGDVNEDGKPDLVTANSGYLANSVSVLLGNGDTTLQPHVEYSAGMGAFAVVLADFNGDGHLDIATANFCGTDIQCQSHTTGTVSVLLGNGTGTFHTHTEYDCGATPTDVVVGDFNGDGHPDLALSNRDSDNVSVLLGRGDGTFQPQVQYPVGFFPLALATADFNRDGKLDLAVPSGSAKTVAVLLGNGDGSFQPSVNYQAGTSNAITSGDINQDGNPDLVLANSNAIVLLGRGDGSFHAPVNYMLGGVGDTVALGDFNRDHAPDIVATASGGVSVLLNNAGTQIKTTSSPNPSTVGQSVVFTAMVKASVAGQPQASGTVTFEVGSHRLATVTLKNGFAKFRDSLTTAGTRTVTVHYSGDANFNSNEGDRIQQTVNP